MATVEYHTDHVIYIRKDDVLVYWRGKSDEFELDFGAPFPPLPEGAIALYYEPNVRNSIIGPMGVLDGGSMPWDFGDECLAHLDDAMAAQKARANPYTDQLDMGGTIEAQITLGV